ncbi:hypothetical protein BSKO_03144 [Bryopsis sp. KO-2023]|nr:hypothetical protein BSKO_03144 [Bryopsis sp. KO-2023]
MSGSENAVAPLGSSSTGCTTVEDLDEDRARSILDGWDELRRVQDRSVECDGVEEVLQYPKSRRSRSPPVDANTKETIASKLRGWTTKKLLKKKDSTKISPESVSPLTSHDEETADQSLYSPDSYQELVKQKLSDSRRLPTVEEGSPNSSGGRENSQMSGFSGWSESSRMMKSSTMRFVSAARTALKQAKTKRMRTDSFARRWKKAALNPAEKMVLLSPFVPRMLKDSIREGAKDIEKMGGSPRHMAQVLARKIKPSMTGMTGAVMVADVTGFTKLTEILSKRGSSGVELLTKCMNNYFTKVMSIVFDYDGDVTKFAGDSMIIAFHSTQDEKANSKDNGLKSATLRCVCCAHELTNEFGKMLMLPNGEVVPNRQKRASAFGINIAHDIIGAASAASFDRSVSIVSSALGRLKMPNVGRHIHSVSSSLRNSRAFHSRRQPGDACSQEDDSVSSTAPSGLRNESTRYSSGASVLATSSATGPATLWGKWLRIGSSSETVGQQSCATMNRRSSTVPPVAPETPQNSEKIAPRVFVDSSYTRESSESRQLNNATQLRASIVDIRNKQEEETQGATHVLALKVVRSSLGYIQLSGGAAYRVTSTPNGDRIKIPSQISKLTYARIFTALPKGALMKSLSIMRMHILDSVREKVEAGQQEFVNEVRRLTVVFLGFPTLKEPQTEGEEGDEVAGVQAAMETVQRCMRVYGGGLLQFRCDEKGFLAICAFGLPGRNHRDNCTRAIHSALKIVEVLLNKDNSRVCAGVTTGDLLCACVGSKDRYEYTVFGDAINLSARLMCKSKAGLGSVLCDDMTWSGAQGQAKYFPLEPLKVKGKEDPVKVYRVEPNVDKKKGTGKGRRRRRSAIRLPPMALRPLIGRDDVMDILNDRIESTLRGESKGGSVLVEGDAGMGKTKIVFELQRSDFGGMRHQAHLFCASSYAANKSILLQPWQIIFKEIFSTDLIMGLVEEGAPNNRRRSPLLDIMEERNSTENWNVRPVTQLGQVLCQELEDYEDGWMAYLGETLDIPPETLPVGRTLLPVNMSFSRRKSKERVRERLVLDDPTRGLLSLGSFLHAVKQEMNAITSRQSISIEPHNLKLVASSPLRKAVSVDESFERALLKVRKEAAESYEDKSDSNQHRVRRLMSMDSIILPGTSVYRRAPIFSTDDRTSIDLKPPKDTNTFINKSFHALRSCGSIANPSTTTEGISNFVAANVNNLNGRSSSYEDVGLGCLQVTKELKTERLLDVMVKVIFGFARLYGPVIIIIENVQHMDSVSWMLLNKLSEEGDGSCLMILTLRPNDGSLASSSAEVEVRTEPWPTPVDTVNFSVPFIENARSGDGTGKASSVRKDFSTVQAAGRICKLIENQIGSFESERHRGVYGRNR